MMFDFYLNDYNVCIEYDGEQHYNKRRDDKNLYNLKLQKVKDDIKTNFCLKNNIKIKEYTPIELKKFITGNGKAEKILVQKCIMKLYGLKEFPEFNDAADALALAYIGMKTK